MNRVSTYRIWNLKMDFLSQTPQLIFEGNTLHTEGHYEASNEKFDAAKVILKTNQLWEKYLYCISKIGLNHCRLGNYELAQKTIEENIEMASHKLGASHLETARAYYVQSLIYVYTGDFSRAIQSGKQALNIRLSQLSPTHESILESYNGLGITYLYTQYQDKAYTYIQKALSIESQSDNHQERAYTYIISGCYFFGIDYIKAHADFDKALNIAEQHLPSNNFSVLWAYLCIGSAYINMGHHSKGLNYTQKALHLAMQSKSEKSERGGMLMINTAKIYSHKEDYDKALHYYETVQKNYSEIYQKDNTHVAKLYNFFGQYHVAVGDTEKALKFLTHSMNIWEAEVKKGHGWYQNINLTMNVIGDLYAKAKNYAEAEVMYKKALNLERHQIPQEHGVPLILVATYNKLSQLFLQQNDLEKATDYNEKAIELNRQIIKGNQIIADPMSLLVSQNNQIKIAIQSKDPIRLGETYQIAKQCEQLINQHRNFYQEYADRIDFNNEVHETFENAIEVCYLLHKRTENVKYLYKAFDYFERNKAYTLLQSIQAAQALRYSDVPDEILEKERTLKTQINYHERRLNQAYLSTQNEQIETHYEALFDCKEQYRRLIHALEKNYPAYYQLKYNSLKIKLKNIQEYLNEKTAIIEFFEGEKSIYSLSIQKEKIHFLKFNKPENWVRTYHDFHNSIANKDFALDTKKAKSTYRLFTKNAHELYRQLLMPAIEVLDSEVEALQIIPGGVLNYIPFELLLKTPPNEDELNYRNLDYLLKDYAFGYAYSATLLLEQQVGKQTDSLQIYGGFAPIYHNDTMKSLEGLVAEYKENKVYSIALRGGLTDLPDARRSVAKIAEMMHGKAILAEDATKKCFVELAGNFRILHLAMHGLVDHENPLYSKLVFTPENNSQDHLLEAGELYNMDINAELTVLSACNTGYGKMHKGEGVMSLSRAFTYAGCPSVVMSLWSVPDIQTSDIMIRFFEALKNGMTKDKALRKAKLDYLANSPFSESHPLFWAGFVPTGDMRALADL